MLRTVLLVALPIITALGLAPTAPSAPQEQKKLTTGDALPSLGGLQFVQGSMDDLRGSGVKVLVVEFWATWCPPCRKSIPHINELYQSLRGDGLAIVGVSDESRGKVEPFVKKLGDQMSYPVALDPEKTVNQAFMAASGQGGIPCAFVAAFTPGQDAGKLVFIGHPMAPEFETAIRMSLTGRYDPVLSKKAEPILEAAQRAVNAKNFKDGYKHYDEVIALDPGVFASVALDKYRVMLNKEGNAAGAKAYASELLKGLTTRADASGLGDLAEALSSDPRCTSYDYDMALLAAEAMLKVAGKNDPAALTTLASVHYARGDFKEAVDFQKKAWRIAAPARKPSLKTVLDAYETALKRGAKVKVPASAQADPAAAETVPAKQP